MIKYLRNTLGLLVIGSLLAVVGSLLQPTQAAAVTDANACLNEGVLAFNLVVFVKVIDGDKEYYADDFTFSISSFQHRSNGNYWNDNKHNTIREQQRGIINAVGPSKQTFHAKLNASGNPNYGNGNLCNPRDDRGVTGKRLAYAFRQGDGTYTAGGTIFSGTPKNNTSLRNQPKYDDNYMRNNFGYTDSDNNGSWLLSCIGDDIGFRLVPNKVEDSRTNGRTGSFVNEVLDGAGGVNITPENFGGGGNDLNHDNVSLIFRYKLDPEDKKARLEAKAKPDATGVVGQPFTFENWVSVTNTKPDNDNTTFKTRITSSGLPSAANWGPQDFGMKQDKEVPVGSGRTYSFTPTAPGRYCRTTQIVAPRSLPNWVNVVDDEATQCINVIAPTPYTVTIVPSGTYTNRIEAESRADFYGKVSISGIPTDQTKWGYTEKATKADYVRADDPINPLDPVSWRCQYAGSPVVISPTQPSKSTCQARCSQGRGDPALRAGGTLKDQGDLNCYQQPRFSLTCDFNPGGAPSTIDVTSDGTYDCATATLNGNISDTGTTTMTPTRPTAWMSAAPGTTDAGPGPNWTWLIVPANWTASTQFIGRPYVKAYGGDVRVGGGVGAVAQNNGGQGGCSTNGNAEIRGLTNAGTTKGAGTQLASLATGSIQQFISGQYNSMSTPVNRPPKGLAFANSISTDPFGGNFGATGIPACIGFVEELGTPSVEVTGDRQLSSLLGGFLGLIPNGTKRTIVVRGNLVVDRNVIYSPLWISPDQIPRVQVVVVGNMYIQPGITQLDGLYAAVQSNSGSGGNIYTCALGIGNIPADTFNDCTSQLVVNGALAANKINLFRDCGTVNRATNPTRYIGGGSSQFCTGNAAAEIVNYTPEQWIAGGLEVDDGYDSISSLPPVL